MKQTIFLLLTFFIPALLGCASVAPIQSARVSPENAAGISLFKCDEIKMEAMVDNASRYVTPVEKFSFFPRLDVAWKNRIQISGYAIPLLFVNLWDLNVKAAIFDFGEEAVGRNLAGSVFIGSSGQSISSSSTASKAGWAGFVLGTNVSPGMEFVLQPSVVVSRDTYWEWKSSYDKTLISIASGDIGGGMIFRPSFLKERVSFTVGWTRKEEFWQRIDVPHPSVEIVENTCSPNFLHFSMLLHGKR